MINILFVEEQSIYTTIAGMMSIIGTAITCICYMPGAIKTLRTNDTRGISLIMFIISTFGCWFWVVISILLFVGNVELKSVDEAVKQNLGMIISNFCLGFFSSIILYKKLTNVLKAKKVGMTEEEYVSKILKEKIKK